MPDLKAIANDPRAQSAFLALVAGALGAVVVNVAEDDPEREDKLVLIGDALKGSGAQLEPARADVLDTGVLHREIRKIRDACLDCIDVGGGLVEPGAEYEAGVNVAFGSQLQAVEDCPGKAHSATVCGLDPGQWTIGATGCENRGDVTWCRVVVTNTSGQAQRFVAYLRVGAP